MINTHASLLCTIALTGSLSSPLLGGDVTGGGVHCQIGSFTSTSDVHKVEFADGYLFAVYYEGVRILDVADPTNPIQVGEFLGMTQAWDIEVVGDFAFVLDFADGLVTLDISDPTNPTQIDAYDIITGAVYHAIATDGYTLAIAAGTDGTLFLDVSDPSSAFLANQYFRPGAYPIEVWMFNDLVFTESWSGGIGIYDAWDPYNPQLLLPEYTSLDDIVVANNTLFGLPSFGYNGKIWISDITDLSEPVLISMTDSPWGTISGTHIAYQNNKLYYSIEGNAIYELDVTDPVLPKYVQNYPYDGYIRDMVVADELMFICGNEFGLAIVDLSDSCADCIVDLTDDGRSDIFDVFLFLDGFLASDPISDFTRNGYFDINDVFYFLELFEAGCP